MLCALVMVLSVAPVFAQETDSDGDTMPDAWEELYGLNPNLRFDANLDLDGDGVKAFEEYTAGTDPTDGSDLNSDGIPDDWATFYGLVGGAEDDDDNDGVSNAQEYEDRTDPTDSEDFVETVTVVVSDERGTPSMEGVVENLDATLTNNNHEVEDGVFRYNDPIGDDKGPGYYTYPTNPVYADGGFDIVSFEVDASGEKTVVFKIEVNADLKQDWGMAADFDIQHFQIYVDVDGGMSEINGGENVMLPGLNAYVAPAYAWDSVILVTPQPDSRVQIELDVKAEDLADYAIIPSSISGQGRTITVVVKKDEFAMDTENIGTWRWQVISQSNEGYPDPEDLLTRNVNEFRGLHRFGGGSDYWGDPEFVDMLIAPAIGSLEEAEAQFETLNVWSSFTDPTMDVKAVVPLVGNDELTAWEPSEGYEEYAIWLSSQIAPEPSKDKYVSDNFTFSGSVNAQWYYNMDNTELTPDHLNYGETGGLNSTFLPESYYDNHIYSRFTLEFYGKAFTDMVNFYARLSTWWGPDAQWDTWDGNPYNEDWGPQYVSMNFEAFQFQLVNPVTTVDYVTIGNYEYGISAWTVGAASYPDRDKFKGVFLDGSTEKLNVTYNAALFYPFPWIGINWSLGEYTVRDYVASGLFSFTPITGLDFQTTAFYYVDHEVGSLDTNTGLTGNYNRLQNWAIDADIDYSKSIGELFDMTIEAQLGYSEYIRGRDETNAVIETGAMDAPSGPDNIYGGFGVATVNLNNIVGSSFSLAVQGFYIDNYYSVMAARGDYNNAARQDVLLMYGNQSAHYYPQDAAGFQKYENVMWEGAANGGWKGATALLTYNSGSLSIDLEGSYWGFNDTNWNILPMNITNGQITPHPTLSGVMVTNNTLATAIRGYLSAAYSLDIGNGLDLEASFLFNQTENWWPMAATSHTRDGMVGPGAFIYGFTYTSLLPKVMAYYQVSKLFKAGLGVQYRNDTIFDKYPGVATPEYKVKGYELIVDLQYDTPLGTLRSYITAFAADNPREVYYGGHTADWRIPYEYIGYRYNVVALTELDVHF